MKNIFSNRDFEITPLNLERDWPEIDRLLELEEWPFVRADLEISHAQPNSVALVARSGDWLHGFFAAHHFGHVGYLDMMVVDRESRVSNVARRLYFGTVRQMKKKGMRAWAAHSTNDSYRMFRFLRFRAGQSFTLLARDPDSDRAKQIAPDRQDVTVADLAEIIRLDEKVFGMNRTNWIEAIAQQPASRFVPLWREQKLVASLCLRERKHNALCLDTTNSLDFKDLGALVDRVLDDFSQRRIECFAKTDSLLHEHLLARGFFVPDFFTPIGPLVEWRKGDVGEFGTSPLIQSLSWF